MAKQQNITNDQGTDVAFYTYVLDSDGEVTDLSDYTARATMRKHWASANSYVFTCDIAANHQISMSMTNVETDLIPPGRYVYDCEIESSANVVVRAVEGVVLVNPSVSY